MGNLSQHNHPFKLKGIYALPSLCWERCDGSHAKCLSKTCIIRLYVPVQIRHIAFLLPFYGISLRILYTWTRQYKAVQGSMYVPGSLQGDLIFAFLKTDIIISYPLHRTCTLLVFNSQNTAWVIEETACLFQSTYWYVPVCTGMY
jgi:hypothetical protein